MYDSTRIADDSQLTCLVCCDIRQCGMGIGARTRCTRETCDEREGVPCPCVLSQVTVRRCVCVRGECGVAIARRSLPQQAYTYIARHAHALIPCFSVKCMRSKSEHQQCNNIVRYRHSPAIDAERPTSFWTCFYSYYLYRVSF